MGKNATPLRSLALLVLLAMVSCMKSPVYQKYHVVPSNQWSSKFLPSYTFDVADTSSKYQLYFLIRHTHAYPFSNIWLNISTLQPGDAKPTNTRVEIPLAETSGKWLGRGMDEIYEQRMPLNGDNGYLHFQKAGRYSITLEQIMREDPLPEVLQVGLRLEKITDATMVSAATPK